MLILLLLIVLLIVDLVVLFSSASLHGTAGLVRNRIIEICTIAIVVDCIQIGILRSISESIV